jgi:hypothetical protein
VSDGVTDTDVPLVTEIFPGVIIPVPPVNNPVRLVVTPTVIVAGRAVKPEIAGATAVTVTVTAWVVVSPAALVTVRV